jgi:predicted Rossmann fold flavoprotein
MDVDVAIVGAGAAGLTAACFASEKRSGDKPRVAVFERNGVPGRKLSITGKGRCNITNSADRDNFLRNIPGNGKFLFSAFSFMPGDAIVEFIESLGVAVELERGGRYFTRSGSAKDVTAALVTCAKKRGAVIQCNSRVSSIERMDGTRRGVDSRFILKFGNTPEVWARSVIISTGGISYPATGSTGDGYRFSESLGHTVIQPRPSLIPLETVEQWPRDMQGLTLKNVTLEFYSPEGKKRFSKLGEMLFTHFGISGPLVLSGSRSLLDCGFSGSTARIDMKPGLTTEKLSARISRDFSMYEKKQLRNAMKDLLPESLIPVVVAQSGLDPESRAGTLGKRGVSQLTETIKGLRLTVAAARPAAEAIVTAGGVKTSEINPSTMESKIVDGLYFCGEIIDVDAYTGGFNLQIAFSTGFLAGSTIE